MSLMSSCLCRDHAPRRAPVRSSAARFSDASRGTDPTGTARLRRDFDLELMRRWRALRDLITEAVDKSDLLHLRGLTAAGALASLSSSPRYHSTIPHGDVVAGFEIWFAEAVRQTVMRENGDWVRPYIQRAIAQSRRRVHEHTGRPSVVSQDRVLTLESHIVTELRGIVSAVAQQCTRAAAAAVLGNWRPARAAREMVRVIRKVGELRGEMMTDYAIVKAFNSAALDSLRNMGHRRVGVVPERRARIAQQKIKDAPDDDDDEIELELDPGLRHELLTSSGLSEVDVLTAGDNDVCEECEDIADNGPYDIDEAEGLIPSHPHCRCAFIPAGEGTSDAWTDDAGDFDESLHPRDKTGKFEEGSGRFSISHKPLDVASLEKVGAQLGSNPGGIYKDKDGDRYYVKEMSPARVTNELVAASLYHETGARTLYYVNAGPDHVATKLADLKKDNVSQLSSSERAEAQDKFAVHAWTANWDAAGLTGDNQGVNRLGQTVTLDVGGALRFRAQGGPKGDAFGPKVTEINSLRDSAKNPMSAKLFGDMTVQQIQESAVRVTSLSDQQIHQAVARAGGDKALAELMVARRDDLKQKVDELTKYAAQQKPTATAAVAASAIESKPAAGSKELQTLMHHPLMATPLKGASSERVALRKLYAQHAEHDAKKAIANRIMGSFMLQHAKVSAKGDTAKQAELAGKIAKSAATYKVDNPLAPKTMKEANEGYTKQEQTTAQELMKQAAPAAKEYTPEETKNYNDLAKISGGESKAEYFIEAAKKALADNPNLALNMTPGEAAHVVAYSGSTYRETNSGLRAGVMNEERWSHTNELSKALQKLPDYKGTVYRRVSDSEDFHKIAPLLQKGMVFEERGFMSSAKRTGVWSGEYHFEITSKHGKDIERISLHKSSESEVLFDHSTRFKITDRQGYKIKMEEID